MSTASVNLTFNFPPSTRLEDIAYIFTLWDKDILNTAALMKPQDRIDIQPFFEELISGSDLTYECAYTFSDAPSSVYASLTKLESGKVRTFPGQTYVLTSDPVEITFDIASLINWDNEQPLR